MIEKMKKLALLIYHGSKNTFLKDLQNLGAVHLETNSSARNDDIDLIQSKLHDLQKAHKILRYAKSNEKKKEIRPVKYENDILELAQEIDREYEQLDEFNVQLEMLEKEIALLEPWGYFEPDNISKLKDEGVNLKFYKMAKAKFDKMEKDFAYEVISEIKGSVYFAVFFQGEFDRQFEEAVEEKLPLKNIKELLSQAEELKQTIYGQLEHIFEYKMYQETIEKAVIALEDELSFFITGESLQPEAEGKILIITGWIPVKREHELKAFLDSEQVAYIIDDPQEDDNVPILLKNNGFARLFEPIVKLHSMPKYTEIDPTPFVAPFFALFFGLCLADLGYGLVMLIGTVIAFFAVKNQKAKPMILLGIVLSLFTILGGFILDTFFGAKISGFEVMPGWLKKGIILGDITAAMSFAIFIGVLQIVLGFILQIVNKVRENGITGGLQPLGTICMLLGVLILGIGPEMAIGPIPIGKIISFVPAKGITSNICIFGGLALVLLFNNIDKKIFIRPALGLWELYGIVTGIPGDILSYIRLFALGLAGGLLGSAFNSIAFMVKGEGFSIVGITAMVLVMIVGHTLNFALAALSAFVHPLRLILLEFYKSVDFTGGGIEYSPFKNRLNKNEIEELKT